MVSNAIEDCSSNDHVSHKLSGSSFRQRYTRNPVFCLNLSNSAVLMTSTYNPVSVLIKSLFLRPVVYVSLANSSSIAPNTCPPSVGRFWACGCFLRLVQPQLSQLLNLLVHRLLLHNFYSLALIC